MAQNTEDPNCILPIASSVVKSHGEAPSVSTRTLPPLQELMTLYNIGEEEVKNARYEEQQREHTDRIAYCVNALQTMSREHAAVLAEDYRDTHALMKRSTHQKTDAVIDARDGLSCSDLRTDSSSTSPRAGLLGGWRTRFASLLSGDKSPPYREVSRPGFGKQSGK